MDREVLSGVVWNPDIMARSRGRLRTLRDAEGVSVVYGHDADRWETLPQAPRPLVGAWRRVARNTSSGRRSSARPGPPRPSPAAPVQPGGSSELPAASTAPP